MSVDTRNPDYLKYKDTWEASLDCYEGSKIVKAKTTRYLPKLSGQILDEKNGTADSIPTDYEQYLSRAVFYNFTKKITNSFNELLYRKNIVIKVPTVIEGVLKNFTYEGKSFLTAIKEASKQILLTDRVGLLLDYPVLESDKPTMTQKEYEQQNIRPYAVFYNTLDIINWRYEVLNNVNTLTQVVLEETYEDVSGEDEFDVEVKKRWRVLDLYRGEDGTQPPVYRVRIFYEEVRKDSEGGIVSEKNMLDEIYPKVNNEYLDYIPFYFLTSRGLTSDLDYSLLNDIVDMNLAHYKNSADYENALHITGSPTPVLIGYDVDPEQNNSIALGSNRALLLNTGGEAYYMEYQGNGVTSLKNALDEKVAVISALAGRVLNTTPKNVESPETARLYRETEHSMLQSMAISLSESYEVILRKICEWMKADGEVSVILNTDYDIQEIEAGLLGQLNTALSLNHISRKTFFYNLQKNEMLPPNWSFEDEAQSIDEDMMNYGSSNTNPYGEAEGDLTTVENNKTDREEENK